VEGDVLAQQGDLLLGGDEELLLQDHFIPLTNHLLLDPGGIHHQARKQRGGAFGGSGKGNVDDLRCAVDIRPGEAYQALKQRRFTAWQADTAQPAQVKGVQRGVGEAAQVDGLHGDGNLRVFVPLQILLAQGAELLFAQL